MKNRQVLIAGGGASGLMAAIMAARAGARVTVLEQNDRPGRKICATGNGKCNFSNISVLTDAYRGTHPEFVKDALRQFSVQDTIRFFSEIGIYVVNRNGGLYPHSGQAQSVVDVLCMEAAALGVKLKTRERAEKIFRDGNGWKAATAGWTYEADAVILANGSRASNIPGADGSGYTLAKSLGHRIIPPMPALTALKCKGNSFASWAGVRTEAEVTLCLNGLPMKKEKGEVQLTEYGISGIPVFQLSRYAIRALAEGCEVSLLVDFLPEYPAEELSGFLARRADHCPYKNRQQLLTGLFPEKLIRVLCARESLETAIKAFPLTVTAGLSFAQAQVCSGGVDTAQVDAHSMESRLAGGLYFAGELLDIDGTCGGYNLQWAWSSGAVAGKHAALGTGGTTL